MLLLKLLLTPLFILIVTLIGRRWGTLVSGLLVGLPLTSAPVALFLALALILGIALRFPTRPGVERWLSDQQRQLDQGC